MTILQNSFQSPSNQSEFLNPEFKDDLLFIQDAVDTPAIVEHTQIFEKLLSQIEPVDFRECASLDGPDAKLTNAHYRIISIEHILKLAERNTWGLCRNQDFIYAFNGCYWSLIDPKEMTSFLGQAAEKLGVPWEKAKDYNFRDQLYKQFLESAHFTKQRRNDGVLIPLLNGTFEIKNGEKTLRPFDRNDFLTYQLPFEYNPQATAPRFTKFINEVLPDANRQLVLAEFIGWIFTTNLKLEKTLLLYGPGANGKSVFFEVLSALLGKNNVSNYSLSSLTNDNGYYRAMLANKLVNYASEINGSLEASIFKQLVSGEPVEARLPYGTPMIIYDYAKLIFNTNQLPHDVEHTHAFFRRFLIIPFDVTIPEQRQDLELARKIIGDELSGVFNWVLSGLDRILRKGGFSECDAIRKQLEQYRKQSDSVMMFIDEHGYRVSLTNITPLKDFYSEYKSYCIEDGYRPVSVRTMGERLRSSGYTIEKRNYGRVIYTER